MYDLKALRLKNLQTAKEKVRESIGADNFIVNSINNIEELEKVINTLVGRLKEWYALYAPELQRSVEDNESYVKLVLTKQKKDILEHLRNNFSMGADLKEEDLKPILSMAATIRSLYEEMASLEVYLEKTMEKHCPNVFRLAGTLIGAKLLRGAGSLKKLSMLRASTIQLLGAEKALFRHIKTGAKSPKYGFILHHPLVQGVGSTNKGKSARILADKLFIAAKVDYFKGDFIADKLLKELEEKLK
jgi:nucleolar protein 56